MPPKAKITKEMILNTTLELTREAGFEAVNARSIAGKLQCSTRPIFTCYENMDALKIEFLDFAFDFYDQYVDQYIINHRDSILQRPYLILPLSYIEFAKEETRLFQLLFINDMDLTMSEPKDFYKEIGNEKKAAAFSDMIGIDPERAKAIFFDLFLYAHGIAVLTAAQKISLSRNNTEAMVMNMLTALIRQEKPDWALADEPYFQHFKQKGSIS